MKEYRVCRFFSAFLVVLIALYTSARMQGQWQIIRHCDAVDLDTLVQKDPREIERILRTTYQKLVNNGYLECRIDTAVVDTLTYYCIQRGHAYTIDSIFILHPDHTLEIKPFRKSASIPFSIERMTLAEVNPLKEYNDHGYPFASLQMDTIQWHEHSANIHWHIEKGPLLRMDSLYIRSDDRVPAPYLRRALQWHKGHLYNENTVRMVDDRIRQTAFLKTAQASAVRFTSSGAQLIIYPQRKPSNTFQGILGIRPDDLTGKINLTGDIELRLWNGLNTGEELYLNWRKLQSQTQDLEARASFNYVLGSAFGPDGCIKIYKRDSTFVSIKLNGGISWKPNWRTTLRGFAEKFTATTLQPSFLFPESSNISATYYGINYHYTALDAPNNPRKGVQWKGEVAMGIRNKVTTNITDTGTRKERYEATRLEMELKIFIPTFKKQCIHISNRTSAMQTDSIAQNEMYRIGGLRTMRGIDEESILATSFSIMGIEYRYLLDEQTAVYCFTDICWWEKKSVLRNEKDTPYSFGVGLNLKTNSGIFTFNYALAKQFDNPILVRNAKVSFGFRSVF